jgi:hypothetical protein
MIKKSLFTAIILILGYEVVIRFVDIKWDTSQNDKSANLISAQNFIYNYSKEQMQHDTVIIGSSMSKKLITQALGQHYVNLAFNGWSSYDGLQILKLTEKKAACLLIETNVVGNSILEPDIENCFAPFAYYSNNLLKSFQLEYQPTGLLVGCIKNSLKNRIEALKKKKRENQALYNFNLKQKKAELMASIPDSILKKSFEGMKELIKLIKEQGTKIVFFEIPIDEQLKNTKLVLAIRKYFHQYFPDSEYKYIDMPIVNDFVYSDGIHLSIQSALPYTLFLKNKLNNTSK